MSKAEELLNSMMEDEDITSEEGHIVVGEDRFITVPETLKRLAVQFDHNIETVTFDCPRYWDDHDMSEMKVYINYRRPDKAIGCYPVKSVYTDEDDTSIMHFDWIISKQATMVAGNIEFNVCIKRVDKENTEVNHWNSEICTDCRISQGLEYDEEVIEEMYEDVVERYLEEALDAAIARIPSPYVRDEMLVIPPMLSQ